MSAQLVLFLDPTNNNLHCEAPGVCARRKLDLAPKVSRERSSAIEDLSNQIRASAYLLAKELLVQQGKEQENIQTKLERQKVLERQRHKTILNYMIANHPYQAHLIDPNWEHAVKRALARYDPKEAKKFQEQENDKLLDVPL